jgi:hypothetical protein
VHPGIRVLGGVALIDGELTKTNSPSGLPPSGGPG